MRTMRLQSSFPGSVKLMAALAVLALTLFVAASAADRHSARAAQGVVFVANEWSRITNESPAPTGYTSGTTVYSTYHSEGRLIQTDSDLLKVIVKDADADSHTPTTATQVSVGSPASGDNVLDSAPGFNATLFLTGQAGVPIAGPNETIKIFSGSTDLIANGTLSITASFSGSPSSDPWISVLRNFGDDPITITGVEYLTSEVNSLTLTATSDLELGGVTVQAFETGLSTGIFHGYLRVTSPSEFPSSSTGAGPENAAKLRVGNAPVSFYYTDTDGVTRQTSATIDTSVPSPVVDSPVNGSYTQDRRPVFFGTIFDSVSGLDMSEIVVAYDHSDDPANTNPVVITSSGALAGSAIWMAVSKSGGVDGDLEFTFTATPSQDIPSSPSPPQHIVDWVVIASDLAGNIGLSDADLATDGVQTPIVRIDQMAPAFRQEGSPHRTGFGWNSFTQAEVRANDSLRVIFDDLLQGVSASDFLVTLDNGDTVTPLVATVINDSANFPGAAAVYLKLPDDLASNETPLVSIEGAIEDVARNSTSTGSQEVADGIFPAMTVEATNGSGTGEGDEGPDWLTKDSMTLVITSTEELSAPPTVSVNPVGESVELSPVAVPSGDMQWTATYTAPVGAVSGDRAVVVSGESIFGEPVTVGHPSTAVFELDAELHAPVIDIEPEPGGNVATTGKPTIGVNFAAGGESSSMSISEALFESATTTVGAEATEFNNVLAYEPLSFLSNGQWTLTIPAGAASDAAGNVNQTAFEFIFEVDAPPEASISMSPGSLPLRFEEPSLVTVSVDDLNGATPGFVRINIMHFESEAIIENASCAGLFEGATVSALQRDSNNFGSWFTCELPTGVTAQSGVIATFEVQRASEANPTLRFRVNDEEGTAFFDGEDEIVARPENVLRILPGTRVSGHVEIQGVTSEPAFSAIGPEVTLISTSLSLDPVTVPVQPDGTFVFEGVFSGQYDLLLDAPGSLGRRLTGLSVRIDDVTLQTVELRGGAANGDFVTGADVSVVTAAFGSGPGDLAGRMDSSGNVVDFDGDGHVTAFDISIVLSAIGQSRIQSWTDPAESP